LAGVGMRLVLAVPEKNLADENAAATLDGIAQGSLDRCLLPWIPLMRGGHRADIIERWKALAAGEPDAERRADWGGLVLVFAEAAGHWPAWKQALEGWNVQTSQQVLEWQAEALQRGRAEGKIEGKAEGKAEAVIGTLQLRFTKKLPKKLQQTVLQTTDLGLLDQWFQTAHTADSLEDFRARTNL
jgi:hypothetical protein